MPSNTLQPAPVLPVPQSPEGRAAGIFDPLCLWRNRVANFGCRIIPSYTWAGVQLGLQYYSDTGGGRQAQPMRSVYGSHND